MFARVSAMEKKKKTAFFIRHLSFCLSSLFSEWGCSAVWHIHLLSSEAKLWQARWQKAVISPPPSVILGQGVSQIPVKSLPAARLQWVSDDGTFHWVSVKANIHAKTEGEKSGDLSGICQVDTPFEHLLCWWDATKENSGVWVYFGSSLHHKKKSSKPSCWAEPVCFLKATNIIQARSLPAKKNDEGLHCLRWLQRNEKKNVASDKMGQDCLFRLNGFHYM